MYGSSNWTPRAKVLLCGWFSFEQGEATAGDLLAGDAVAGWLQQWRLDYDVALSPVLRGNEGVAGREGNCAPRAVTLDQSSPSEYSHLVFVCGPLAGEQIEKLVERFKHAVRIAVGVSATEGPAGFDVVVPRDRPGLAGGSVDLSFAVATDRTTAPIVGLCFANPQPEYSGGRHDRVRQLVEQAIARVDAGLVALDTRTDPRSATQSSPTRFERVVERMDLVISSRLHGLVLALRAGVPVLAIDPIQGGAKVLAQANALRWPAVIKVEDATPEVLAEGVSWCLTEKAKELARQRSELGPAATKVTASALLDVLVDTGAKRASGHCRPVDTSPREVGVVQHRPVSALLAQRADSSRWPYRSS